MSAISRKSMMVAAAALLAVPATGAFAQAQDETLTTVYGERVIPAASEMTDGPELDGIISARSGAKMQVTAEDGTPAVVTITDETEIKSKGGFLGLGSKDRAATSLMNGLPVTVATKSWNGQLFASQIKFKNDDLEMASMIRNGTAQQFAEHDTRINKNQQVTEALKGRMGDLDQYNVKGTTNVNFDTGKWNLTEADKNQLCATASQADSMDNALLLVVGYTDSVGDYEYNQVLSEKRAGRVVNHLQQACGWKPYRMLTPTGMAEADPIADNDTAAGKAQNRRVAVNILVSKGLDGI